MSPSSPGRGHLPVRLSPEVEVALDRRQPVVALESTLIAHGLPRPGNLQVGRELELLLRDRQVAPATIAVLDGVVHVGLDGDQIERVATRPGAKASVRDLPVVIAKGIDAATTVAATATVAHLVGIAVFATGGLGGVHPGANLSFDESADLEALSRTPIAVVAAGVKSILDVAATLERLESRAVTVVGYGTGRFPGFFVRDSGHALEWRADTPAEVCDILDIGRRLGLPGALVVANPIPAEDQLDPDLHTEVLTASRQAARQRELRGKELSPFLLDYIQRETAGKSLEANIEAVRGNVRLAADIAVAWSQRPGPS